MLGEGMKVRFVPFYNLSQHLTNDDNWRNAITGTIIYINWEHHFFTVEYSQNQRENFKFHQIGNEVRICGRN